MRMALRLARRGYGRTSPNPMVGAVLVKDGRVLGQGWHRKAGQPHAEIEAIRNVAANGNDPRDATLYVSLEPCSTQGRTPPCTEAIQRAGIAEVVVGATDPNPQHAGRAYGWLQRQGIQVRSGVCADECAALNEAFNHWIVRRTPFVTVKAAMSLDGKIATASGESKWITGPRARAVSMRLRRGADAILVGVNTVLRDNPRLTVRHERGPGEPPRLRRLILDAQGRTPADALVFSDACAELTTWIIGPDVPAEKIRIVSDRVRTLVAPAPRGKIDLPWLLARLGEEGIVNLLVEGGGEVNASFLFGGHAQRVAFFYAPIILGGRQAPTGVEGEGAPELSHGLRLHQVQRRILGPDLLLTGLVHASQAAAKSF